MCVRIIKVSDRHITINGKDSIKDMEGNWICSEELTMSETKDFKEFKKSLENSDEVCMQGCENCDKKFDIDTMESDDDGVWLCKECWKHLLPVMIAEGKEAKALEFLNEVKRAFAMLIDCKDRVAYQVLSDAIEEFENKE